MKLTTEYENLVIAASKARATADSLKDDPCNGPIVQLIERGLSSIHTACEIMETLGMDKQQGS